METKNNQTKRVLGGLWIYPRFQGILIINQFIFLGIVFAFITLLTYQSYHHLTQQGMQSGLNPNHPYFQFLHLQFKNFCVHLAIAFSLSFIFLSISTLILSHRLAGPITRLKSFFGNIAQNGLKPGEKLSFRKGDFFYELPSLINAALEKISKKELSWRKFPAKPTLSDRYWVNSR